MGRTDRAPETYPRLADVIGYVPVNRLLPTVDAVMSVQRDYGDRRNRAHARFKYTIDDKRLKWIKEEIERRQGFSFQPAHSYQFTSNGDEFGWIEGAEGYRPLHALHQKWAHCQSCGLSRHGRAA